MYTQCYRFDQFWILAFALLWAESSLAAGFYLSEVGTPASVGTAGVANPTNNQGAGAAWTNPAGMTGLEQEASMSGAMLLVPKIEFDSSVATAGGSDGGNAGDVSAIPSYFHVKILSDDTRLGFSVVAPFGGGLDYGDNFVGRYAIQNVVLGGLAFTPSLGYKVNDRLSLGFGISILYSTMEQEIAINTPGPGDGQAKFRDLEDWGYQGILSLTYQLTADTMLGVVYRSEADMDLEGDLKIEGLPIPDSDVELSWDNPQWLELGLSHALTDQRTLAFNLGWQEWSAFSENVLTIDSAGASQVVDRKWDDTWHAGVAYRQKLSPESFYSLGISYESSPIEDKYRTFDFPLDEIWKLSGAYAWEGINKFDYSVGATLYLTGDASIDQTSQGVRAAGDYDNNMMLFLGGTLRYVID